MIQIGLEIVIRKFKFENVNANKKLFSSFCTNISKLHKSEAKIDESFEGDYKNSQFECHQSTGFTQSTRY